MSIPRPEIVQEEHLTFLDDLRDSGLINMMGAGSSLEANFGFDKHEAKTVLLYWMETFEERLEATNGSD